MHVAVGTPVTGCPPHRSVRAGLPHTAPTLSNNAISPGFFEAVPFMQNYAAFTHSVDRHIRHWVRCLGIIEGFLSVGILSSIISAEKNTGTTGFLVEAYRGRRSKIGYLSGSFRKP